MSEILVKKLVDSGLSEAEAQVYVALLPRASMTIQEVADCVDIPRSTVVLALEKLARLGVIDEYTHGKRRNFVISSAAAIERYMDEQAKIVAAQQANLGRLITDISQLHFLGSTKGATVEVLKGEGGFKELYERTLELKKDQEILRFGVMAEKFVFFPEFLREYVAKKNKKGILSRLLIPDTALGKETKKADKKDLRETRFLPVSSYNPDSAIAIWGNTVSFTLWNESLETIVIQSQPIVDILRSTFEIAWKNSKK